MLVISNWQCFIISSVGVIVSYSTQATSNETTLLELDLDFLINETYANSALFMSYCYFLTPCTSNCVKNEMGTTYTLAMSRFCCSGLKLESLQAELFFLVESWVQIANAPVM